MTKKNIKPKTRIKYDHDLKFRISKYQLKELNDFCVKNKMEKSNLIREAIRNYVHSK